MLFGLHWPARFKNLFLVKRNWNIPKCYLCHLWVHFWSGPSKFGPGHLKLSVTGRMGHQLLKFNESYLLVRKNIFLHLELNSSVSYYQAHIFGRTPFTPNAQQNKDLLILNFSLTLLMECLPSSVHALVPIPLKLSLTITLFPYSSIFGSK